MLRLQYSSSSPVGIIILLIINFIIFSSSAPIAEEFQEIDLPTDEITENELSRLSDSELLELERALQQKIEEFENEKNGFVEDAIPMNRNFDEERLLRAMAVRERRAGGRSGAAVVPVLGEDGAVELFPLMQDETQPIVIIQEPLRGDELQFQQQQGGSDDRQFVLIPEGEDELAEAEAKGLIPIELPAELQAELLQDQLLLQQQQQQQMQEQPQPILLSENEIDELQLRQRLADLGEQLTKRAIRGF